VRAYAELAQDLRQSLRDGAFADGTRLPTEEELARDRGVSRQTVRRAMQDLVAEGLIYRVAGRGTFPVSVNDRFIRQLGSIEDLMALNVDTEVEVVRPLHQRIDIESAGRLRLPSDNVMSLSLVRYHSSRPIALTTAYFSTEIGAELASLPVLTEVGRRRNLTVFGLIEQETHRVVREAEQSITAVAGPGFATELLDAEPNAPLLRVDRLYLGIEGAPLELAISYFNPEYYSYRIRLQRHFD
jgi:GntR family transcriptional regulator